jgi:hypothetical protein
MADAVRKPYLRVDIEATKQLIYQDKQWHVIP